LGCPAGLFRPTDDSKMRSLDKPYERVDAGLLVERMDALLPPSPALAPSGPGPVRGMVELEASAEDGVAVARLEVLVDGKSLGNVVQGSAPRLQGRWTWDTGNAGPGVHAVTV